MKLSSWKMSGRLKASSEPSSFTSASCRSGRWSGEVDRVAGRTRGRRRTVRPRPGLAGRWSYAVRGSPSRRGSGLLTAVSGVPHGDGAGGGSSLRVRRRVGLGRLVRGRVRLGRVTGLGVARLVQDAFDDVQRGRSGDRLGLGGPGAPRRRRSGRPPCFDGDRGRLVRLGHVVRLGDVDARHSGASAPRPTACAAAASSARSASATASAERRTSNSSRPTLAPWAPTATSTASSSAETRKTVPVLALDVDLVQGAATEVLGGPLTQGQQGGAHRGDPVLVHARQAAPRPWAGRRTTPPPRPGARAPARAGRSRTRSSRADRLWDCEQIRHHAPS